MSEPEILNAAPVIKRELLSPEGQRIKAAEGQRLIELRDQVAAGVFVQFATFDTEGLSLRNIAKEAFHWADAFMAVRAAQ